MISIIIHDTISMLHSISNPKIGYYLSVEKIEVEIACELLKFI